MSDSDKQAGWGLAELKHSSTTPSASVNKNHLIRKKKIKKEKYKAQP